MKNLYKKLLALDNMEKYFPSEYPKGRGCDRDYMFNVANTLHQGVVQDLINHALKQRHDPKMEQNKSESIMISEKWMEELKSLPLVKKVRKTLNLNFHTELIIVWVADLSCRIPAYQEPKTLSSDWLWRMLVISRIYISIITNP